MMEARHRPNHPKTASVLDAVAQSFVSDLLYILETGDKDYANHQSVFADHVFTIYLRVREALDPNFGMPFVDERMFFAVAKELVNAGYLASQFLIQHLMRETLVEQIADVQTAWQAERSVLNLNTPNLATLDDWMRASRTTVAKDRVRRNEMSAWVKPHVLHVLKTYMNQFLRNSEACQHSRSAEACLLGLYADARSWPKLLAPTVLMCQYQVDEHMLDFAIVLPGQRKLGITVGGDAHQYHGHGLDTTEAQPEQIFHQAEWRILRFHRQEIATDLATCIGRIHTILAESTQDSSSDQRMT